MILKSSAVDEFILEIEKGLLFFQIRKRRKMCKEQKNPRTSFGK
jgi:hypothetical protein